MNNEKNSGFKRNHAGGDEKLVVNKCWPYYYTFPRPDIGGSSVTILFIGLVSLGVQ